MTDLHADLAELVSKIEDAAYERGKADARRELLEFLGDKPSPAVAPQSPREPYTIVSETINSGFEEQERQRAPKGMARTLILRAMRESIIGGGIEPKDASEAARTDLERMVQVSSIRGELRRGRDKGQYVERNGKWYLADGEVDEEAESDTSKGAPSASSLANQGGSEDAAALASNPDRR